MREGFFAYSFGRERGTRQRAPGVSGCRLFFLGPSAAGVPWKNCPGCRTQYAWILKRMRVAMLVGSLGEQGSRQAYVMGPSKVVQVFDTKKLP